MSGPESMPELFERLARQTLSAEPTVVHRWEAQRGAKRRLVIPQQCEGGFEIIAEAETYGLYAFAQGWHSGAWDWNTAGFTPEEMAVDFLGFIRTLLSSDAHLDVHYAGRTLRKIVMHYRDEAGWRSETTGMILFNYFGRSRVETFQNTVLAARY